MRETLKLLVTPSEIGVLLEVSAAEAKTAVARARDLLKQFGDTPSPDGRHAERKNKKTTQSLSERILSLGADFFAEPKESMEISKELARASFYYEAVRIRDELRRLVARGQLRRLGDGTRANPFKYVNR